MQQMLASGWPPARAAAQSWRRHSGRPLPAHRQVGPGAAVLGVWLACIQNPSVELGAALRAASAQHVQHALHCLCIHCGWLPGLGCGVAYTSVGLPMHCSKLPAFQQPLLQVCRRRASQHPRLAFPPSCHTGGPGAAQPAGVPAGRSGARPRRGPHTGGATGGQRARCSAHQQYACIDPGRGGDAGPGVARRQGGGLGSCKGRSWRLSMQWPGLGERERRWVVVGAPPRRWAGRGRGIPQLLLGTQAQADQTHLLLGGKQLKGWVCTSARRLDCCGALPKKWWAKGGGRRAQACSAAASCRSS